MHLTIQDIQDSDKIKRLNIINSITGIKPGNLVGSVSKEGKTNLAIISSVVHLSSKPPLVGFIMRPNGDVKRDTYNNILENGLFTINHIPVSHIEQAHYTSAKFETAISEFSRCGFSEEYLEGFEAPFVKESNIKIGLKLIEEVEIKSSNTRMIVGEIQHLVIPDNALDETGYIDLEKAESIGISGLNSYYKLQYLDSFPYARVEEVPMF
ncbi:MAG: flavin reductase [Salibacteraceae bacterium]|nr:flavin reductase [Salibacteraceae bacterium]|tara:strand:+ start:36086 stop:36715 length:630 start_codon:yes stop_codon:yes gene_type:complete